LSLRGASGDEAIYFATKTDCFAKPRNDSRSPYMLEAKVEIFRPI
jgi:hypothetical protein